MRPWKTSVLFALCLAVLLSVLAWFSTAVLRLERENIEAARRESLEETVRLALWRMDAAISPFIIAESSRPYFEYTAFSKASVVNPNRLKSAPDDEIVPSPLLFHTTSTVNLYFNGTVDEQGNWRLTSPQVPTGQLLKLALDNYEGMDELIDSNSDQLEKFATNIRLKELSSSLTTNSEVSLSAEFATELSEINAQLAETETSQSAELDSAQDEALLSQKGQNGQALLNTLEFSRRRDQYNKAQREAVSSRQQAYQSKKEVAKTQGKGKTVPVGRKDAGNNVLKKGWTEGSKTEEEPAGGHTVHTAMINEIDESIMQPFWVDDFLLLARMAEINGEKQIQGAWLNWASIRKDLLAEIGDLFPSARLIPAKPGAGMPVSRMMAALPVRLAPGKPSLVPSAAPYPLRIPLIIAWSFALLAAVAVGLLLVGVVSLSERRAAFVSAVTHEMRTPLTTFRMYSEMLAENMVVDEQKRKDYLRTMCAEGNRLSHLVENVLFFARLERGRARSRMEELSVEELFSSVKARLDQRAQHAGMKLVTETSSIAEGVTVKTDISVVEQILFNLVDNACKYAGCAEDKRIHMAADLRGGAFIIRVYDHGPGIPANESGVLFKPFRKSAEHAAESAPGVGLGLALSRRLARQIGGNLKFDKSVSKGACFEMIIPLS